MINKSGKSYRLTEENIFDYLKNEYKATGIYSLKQNFINMLPLVQKDYGLALDCTLTSITAVIYYLMDKKTAVQGIYDTVEKIAKKYLYNGEKTGTYSIFIKKIFDESLNAFMPDKKNNSKQSYFKRVGYSWDKVCKEIDNDNPVILSLWNDGRGYYKNHTITIIGYRLFKINNKKVRMLIVYDNWYKTRSYVDFEKLCGVSSINYL